MQRERAARGVAHGDGAGGVRGDAVLGFEEGGEGVLGPGPGFAGVEEGAVAGGELGCEAVVREDGDEVLGC